MSDYSVFWQWCLSTWRSTQVERRLLELQESHDVVILEVLIAAWLGRQGIALDTQTLDAMRAVSQRWVTGVVIPLRRQRVAWRTEAAAESCRSAIKALELQAEKTLGELLYAAAASQLAAHPHFAPPCHTTVTQNLTLALQSARPAIDAQCVGQLVTLLGPSQATIDG